MKVGIIKEITSEENRVAATPETVGKMIKKGFEVLVETGAGENSIISDNDYQKAGAAISSKAADLLSQADIVLKVQQPTLNSETGLHEVDMFREGSVLIAFLQPANQPELLKKMASKKISALAMELIPRITRAQGMDALSSMANIAGYKSVLEAANTFRRFFPLLMTAAGTVTPAKVLILGAGVAGLQAIATAKRLGAVVKAFDTRPVVKEQVESLGADFINIDMSNEEAEDSGGYAKELSKDFYEKEKEAIHQQVKNSDIIISTAQIPGKKAPLLITEEMVKDMKPGSVIVDLAVEQGGNCALSEMGKVVNRYGVTIIGKVNLPSLVPVHASQLYSRNLINLLFHLFPKQDSTLDLEDEITFSSLVTHEGVVRYSPQN